MSIPEDDVPSHEELRDRVTELEDEIHKALEQAGELSEKFELLDTEFRNTSGNDDGNEDRQETYSEDNEGSSGADKGEELYDLSNFMELENTFDSKIAEINKSIDTAYTAEQRSSLLEKIETLESDFKDSKPDCLD